MAVNESLENLVRTGGLKVEPPSRNECEGLLRSAMDRLKDAHNIGLSFASRFDLAYNAAHALALTASRLQGYRSDRRYLGNLSKPPARPECKAHGAQEPQEPQCTCGYMRIPSTAQRSNRARAGGFERFPLVFQCLVHTLALDKAQVRLFALCHDRRNLAEYEGYLTVDETLVAELIAATDTMQSLVQNAMADFVKAGKP